MSAPDSPASAPHLGPAIDGQPELSAEAEQFLRRLRDGHLLGEAPTGAPERKTEGAAPALPTAAQPAPAQVGSTQPALAQPVPQRPSWRDVLGERVPIGLRGAVLDPAARGALALGLVALIAALVALGLAWRSAPREVPVGAAGVPVLGTSVPPVAPAAGLPAMTPAGPSVSSPAPAGSAPAQGRVVVDVAGKVRRPGVVSLPAESRVADALRLAGGVLPGTDTSALSLARRLVDGEQVLVTGEPGVAPAPLPAGPSVPAATGADGSGGAGGPGAASSGPLDLNAATVEQLDGLPGVGPVLAGRIIEWRTAHNGFTSVEQLREVKGLGGKTGSELLPLVRVG